MEECLCIICQDIPCVPVKVKVFDCECGQKMRWCLTCLRDSLNMNGRTNGAGAYCLINCPLCRKENIYGETWKYRNPCGRDGVYEVDESLMQQLDAKYGAVACPRKCEWKGLRDQVQAHLQQCDNTFRFKCVCRVLFTKTTLIEHLQNNANCARKYRKCLGCDGVFENEYRLIDHELICLSELDAKYGPTTCPHKCPWTGFRVNLSEHLKICDNVCRFRCRCGVFYTKSSLLEHIKNDVNCANHFPKCLGCNELFVHEQELTQHQPNCLIEFDAKFGPVACPKGCPWNGLRVHIYQHFKTCYNGYNFRCECCDSDKIFDRALLEEHLNTTECGHGYFKCFTCQRVFITHEEYNNHKINCALDAFHI